MTKDEALDLALEALEYIENNYMSLPKSGSEAITAIKQARSAPVQQPVLEVLNGQINRAWDAIPANFTGLLYILQVKESPSSPTPPYLKEKNTWSDEDDY